MISTMYELFKDPYKNTHVKQHKPVWTMGRVNTIKLNVRSNPGANSPVVGQLNKGDRLAFTGEPVKIGDSLWIRVSTDDGKIQDWANRKFLDP